MRRRTLTHSAQTRVRELTQWHAHRNIVVSVKHCNHSSRHVNTDTRTRNSGLADTKTRSTRSARRETQDKQPNRRHFDFMWKLRVLLLDIANNSARLECRSLDKMTVRPAERPARGVHHGVGARPLPCRANERRPEHKLFQSVGVVLR